MGTLRWFFMIELSAALALVITFTVCKLHDSHDFKKRQMERQLRIMDDLNRVTKHRLALRGSPQ